MFVEAKISHSRKQIEYALLAQLVERTTLNRVVVGSIPTQGVTFLTFFCQFCMRFVNTISFASLRFCTVDRSWV